MVSLFGPVGGVVILGIVIIGRVAVEEGECAHIGHLVGQHLCGIESVFLIVEHLGQTRHQLETTANIHIDAGSHTLITLGIDENHAVGTFGTIDGTTVLEYGDILDILHIDVGEDVVVVSAVQHALIVLQVSEYTIYDYKRLRIALQGVDTLHEHHVALSRIGAAGYAADVGTQTLLDDGIDAHIHTVVVDVCGVSYATSGSAAVITAESRCIKTGIHLI